MEIEKDKYIEKKLNEDSLQKAKSSAVAQILAASLYFFLYRSEAIYRTQIYLFLFIIIGTVLHRLMVTKKYFKNEVKKEEDLNYAVRVSDFTSILSGFAWGAAGIYSILTYQNLTINILVTFIMLLAFSLGSIISLSNRRNTMICFNLLILSPLAYYAFAEFKLGEDTASLWLVGYLFVNIIYATKQAGYIKEELINRFSAEYDLKKSLEEVALSKKHLEEETMKTFHVSRLSSLGEMAGGVAHEINNPLTIIQGLSKSMLTSEADTLSESVKNKLNKINSAGERIAKIVKGMKIISSKNDNSHFEDIKVSAILELSISLFEERLKNENVMFSIVNEADPEVNCNLLQISQILINLIGNALDAMEIIKEEHSLWIKVNDAGEFVEVRVINAGPLIPEAVLNRIFEPFYSTKALGKGTGLGLSISQTLAKNNGGDLSYEVYEDKVCFKLNLKKK